MMFTATQASCGSLEKGGGEKGGTSAERKGRNLCREKREEPLQREKGGTSAERKGRNLCREKREEPLQRYPLYLRTDYHQHSCIYYSGREPELVYFAAYCFNRCKEYVKSQKTVSAKQLSGNNK